MGKSEILLLIASVAIGIALMVGIVIPIMKDGKDMVETRNLAQEMAAVKDKLLFNQMIKTYEADTDDIKIGGTNFLTTTGYNDYPYKAKNTGALFSYIDYKKATNTGEFKVNLAGTNAGKIDFEDSESLKTICDSNMSINSTDKVITCKFKAN